jgi:hypothetical protein
MPVHRFRQSLLMLQRNIYFDCLVVASTVSRLVAATFINHNGLRCPGTPCLETK